MALSSLFLAGTTFDIYIRTMKRSIKQILCHPPIGEIAPRSDFELQSSAFQGLTFTFFKGLDN